MITEVLENFNTKNMRVLEQNIVIPILEVIKEGNSVAMVVMPQGTGLRKYLKM